MSKLVITEPSLDHLEFYEEHNISPVRQDITDLERHFERRSSLYQQLGVPGLLFNGKKILEVGPGSGHNSLYVASCMPETYDLIEPNKSGQKDIKDLYSQVDIEVTKPNLIGKKLEDFKSTYKYDVVICECWLGVSQHERNMMKKLGTLLAKGGILITTIGSPLGGVANSIRRVLAWSIRDTDKDIQHNTQLIVEAFQTHLDTIQDMSRLSEDWVQDVLINPAFFLLHPTPGMFIEDMGNEFDIYQTYPKFTQEWRFYKSLYGKNKRLNKTFLDSYYRNVHNFFDYLIHLPVAEMELNVSLEKEAFDVINTIAKKENEEDHIIDDSLRNTLELFFNRLIEINVGWYEPLQEVMELMAKPSIQVSDIQSLRFFNKIFGRELIYAAAIKK